MSHLNAVTVLLAAFATRGSKLKAEANQADSNIPQRFRAVPQKYRAGDWRSQACVDFRPVMQRGNGSLNGSLADHKSANQAQISL
ncbi:hypothetical protein [Bradyrhizobium sp. SSUT77]|uniref:hypothetical protein n=1 Tax=Bradyrhizobium sp. SSUT77 TaxID=3040603 RepID=UPI00244973DB|nr:hypothetical protein [Bradyrhizobium sp. SSUT77]MDH2346520.1 hypothetical protein [Bradyrhizobium sp. SSUT77]